VNYAFPNTGLVSEVEPRNPDFLPKCKHNLSANTWPSLLKGLFKLNTVVSPYPWSPFLRFQSPAGQEADDPPDIRSEVRSSLTYIKMPTSSTSLPLVTLAFYHFTSLQEEEGWEQYNMFWEKPYSHNFRYSILKLFYFIVNLLLCLIYKL